MPYEYREDIVLSDVAFRAWGETLEETFLAAADATLGAMFEDVEALATEEERSIEVRDEQLDLLLLQMLQELIFYKDAESLLLRLREVTFESTNGGYVLRGKASGERIDPEKHELGGDVKGVTLHGLAMEQTDTGWEARVVLDM